MTKRPTHAIQHEGHILMQGSSEEVRMFYKRALDSEFALDEQVSEWEIIELKK